MASGRVGGTKSKVSGQVGSEVYSIRRNADGTYSQVVAAKPEVVRYSNTQRQAAQRMVTAMIEVMMRDLTPVARISFQSGANQSKSLNAFSSINLMRVREDMQANWYGDAKFVYPIKGGDISQGGAYLISSGTLQPLPYEHKEFKFVTPEQWDGGINDIGKAAVQFAGFRFEGGPYYTDMGGYLEKMKFYRSDKYVVVVFREYHKYNPETEADDISYGYEYCIAKLKPNIPDNYVFPNNRVSEIFDIQTNGDAVAVLNHQWNRTNIGLIIPADKPDDNIIYWGCFAISWRNGFKQVQHVELSNNYGTSAAWISGHAPTNVFWSWNEGEPMHDMPSPF